MLGTLFFILATVASFVIGMGVGVYAQQRAIMKAFGEDE